MGLIDFNPSVQQFHIERVKKYLDLAYEYKAKNVLLVLGEYIWNQEVIPPEEQWKTGVENMKTENGIKSRECLAIENCKSAIFNLPAPIPRRVQAPPKSDKTYS